MSSKGCMIWQQKGSFLKQIIFLFFFKILHTAKEGINKRCWSLQNHNYIQPFKHVYRSSELLYFKSTCRLNLENAEGSSRREGEEWNCLRGRGVTFWFDTLASLYCCSASKESLWRCMKDFALKTKLAK